MGAGAAIAIAAIWLLASATVVIPGKDLRRDEPQLVRHLFVHVPGAGDPRAAIESLAIVTTFDATARAAPRSLRLVASGEVRDVVPVRGAGDVSYAVEGIPARAELLFGLHLPEGESIQARVTVAAGGPARAVFDQVVAGRAWRDFRAPLPAAAHAVITLETRGNGPDTLVYWSAPILVAPGERAAAPNVVLYVVDSLRAGGLGAYGAVHRQRVRRHAVEPGPGVRPRVDAGRLQRKERLGRGREGGRRRSERASHPVDRGARRRPVLRVHPVGGPPSSVHRAGG
jgi:hypothetical protein